ncbi:MAG: EpsI family protein [Proteobacteria bacterium]|nr:EpsI family protein [Pseudomonadota bacterium]MBU1388544.1 EpsI family protein [Pseudomonadota bacterium]MBU1544841.1 EpsI family protein [Pseudomonadota bacterium]MBU2430370.1 EpsI family protein [Pseudomonadota bacterium]MBU2482680.1 EpsI family protein [Pseudomonadota bacterium]
MLISETKFYNKPVFQAAVLVLLFIAAYWIPFSSLYNTWTTNDDYSFGLLIPFISLYLFWEKKPYLNEIEFKNNWFVFPFLIVFVLLSIYGILGSSGHISRPALPVLIILFAIFCFGWDFFKKFSLPLCFLIFMIPLPTVLDRTVGVFLKNISSELGGAFLRFFGYSVHVSGNVIDLGITKLQVVDACSGLRFLFPLMALGIIYGYFFEKVTWKRVLCFIATIPIAVFTNVLRIGIAGILTYQFGSQMAEGFFHDFQGLAIFIAAFIFLFIFGRFLRLFPPKGKKSVPTPFTGSEINDKNLSMTAFVVSVVLLVTVGFLTLNTQALPPLKITGGIESFPLSFDGWEGRSEIVDPEIIDASGAEEAFSGVYVNPDGKAISLYMGYRSTAFLENVNFFHSPTVCLPSSGWKTISQKKRIVKDVPVFGSLPVIEMVMESMGQKNLVYFWFQTKSKVSEDKNINRYHLALHAIQKDNTHDLFIRPITQVSKTESMDIARDRMDEFVRTMMKNLDIFLKKNQFEEK